MGAGAATQVSVVEMESKTLTPGGSNAEVYNLTKLPAGRRVTAFCIEYTVTQDGGGGGAVANPRPSDFAAALTSVQHESDFLSINGTGMFFDRFYHAQNGKKLLNAEIAGVAGGTPTTFRYFAVIPLSDPRAMNPNDFAIPSAALRQTPIQVNASVPALLPHGDGAAITAAAGKMYAWTIPEKGLQDPVRTQYGFADWGKSAKIPKGIYRYLFAYKESGANTTVAEITDFSLTMDGQIAMTRIATTQLIAQFDHYIVHGGFEDNDAEQLSDDSAPFQNVIAPNFGYKLTDLPSCDAGEGDIAANGSANAIRYGYCIAAPKSVNAVVNLVQASGHNVTADQIQREHKTLKGKGLNAGNPRSGFLASILPGRVHVPGK